MTKAEVKDELRYLIAEKKKIQNAIRKSEDHDEQIELNIELFAIEDKIKELKG
jgi:hypothetical protein